PSPASGSIVQALDLEELVAQSDRIVIGRVVFSESFQRRSGAITTWYRIEVERDLREGALPDSAEREVIVQVMGGRIGNLGMRVEGEPSFTEGERALIFIRDGGGLVFRPVGMAQGVMRIRSDNGNETVQQSREGMMLVRRNSTGRLEASEGALPRKERLDTVIERVRAAVRKQAGAAR
ncbi:MAG: hypothetical protein WBG86_05645, partial [Polyangiales bacterium]